MPTVDKKTADMLVEVNGKYETDTQVTSIIEYDNAWGGKGYGVNYGGVNNYTPSPYVRNPRVYWEVKK